MGTEPASQSGRHFLEKHRSGESPYPTSRDLYREFQAVTPDALQSLLADLFEKVTLWDLRAKQAANHAVSVTRGRRRLRGRPQIASSPTRGGLPGSDA